MRIQSHKLKNIIDIIQKEQRNIILKVEQVKHHEKEPYRKTYKSYIFLFKILNHYYSKNIQIKKHDLYFRIKSEMINYKKEPFYKILNLINDI